MNMSQPLFSRQIAALERDLGTQLVERNSRNVALTPAGQRFLVDARAVLAKFDATCRDARLVAEGKTGELRLGFMMHAARGIVPRLVRRYVEMCPNVRLVLEENTSADIGEMLREGKLDAAITLDAPLAPPLVALPLLQDSLRLIVPAGHALARRKRVAQKDLAGEALIAAPASVVPTLRVAIMAYCESGWRPAAHHAGAAPAAHHHSPGGGRLGHRTGAGVPVWRSDSGGDLPAFDRRAELAVVLVVPVTSGNPALVPLVALVKDNKRWRF